MHCLIASHFCVSKTLIQWLFLTAILCFSVPLGFADEKQDLAASNALIAIIESQDSAIQVNQAEDLFASIPAESKSKPLAAMAIALIYIRENRFSEAWRVLAAISKDQGSVPDSIKLGKERLKLWLLLEAGAGEKAEAQFKQVVTMTLGIDSASIDLLTANCGLIGGVVGMLRADGKDSGVSISTLEKGKEVLLVKIKAKNATSKLEEQFAEASQRGHELLALVGRFESVGDEKAEKLNSSTQAEYQRIKQEQLDLRDDLKSAGGEKRDLEENRTKWIRKRSAILAELKRETPGKPRQPRQPSKPTKSPPKLPKGFLNPTERERAEREYVRDMREYNDSIAKYILSSAQHERDMAVYNAQYQIWKQADDARRAPLQAELQRVGPEVASAEKALKDMQSEIKQGVALDLKQNTNKYEQLKRSASISSIAFEHVTSNDPKTKRLLRPSNFNLLDYQWESTRLRKSLRDIR